MKKTVQRISLLLFALILAYSPTAIATTIDLNDFWADPTVSVALNGLNATIAEDANFSPVLLVNDPSFGDPNVIIPQSGYDLLFEYDFREAVGEDDEFGVFIMDAGTGGSIGAAYEFFTQTTGSGTISFDLTALVGQTLGLQFQLSALTSDTGFDSVLDISNLRIEQTDPIPEPSTILLLGLGLLGTARISRKKFLSET